MSQEIDKRVVEMQFDNKQFEKNVQQSLGTIDKLKLALDFDGSKGFESLTRAANKLDLSNISSQTEHIKAEFSALQIAGYTMIQELTKSFINFGKNLWANTFGQIKSGGMARALKIEQANFKMEALAKNIKAIGDNQAKVNALMEQMGTAIDRAVTGTAYGYDAAADVASQLMASGVTDAEAMENHLLGIAGAAAMTGNSFEQIGHVFTTVASNGKLMTMQLRQFSTYGLNLSATLAKNLNTTEARVNEMVSDGLITFQQFSDALYEAYGDAAQKADDTFAGITTNIKAQLSRLGQRFAVPFIENAIPFLKTVKQAIKDISSAIAPMAERFGKSFGYLTRYGTAVMNSINFKNIEMLFRGIENIIYSLVLGLHSLHNAFKRVFPRSVLDSLYEGTRIFLQFTEAILPTKRGLEGLENVFVAILTPLRLVFETVRRLTIFLTPIVSVIFNIVNAVFELFSFTTPFLNLALDFIDKTGILNKLVLILSNSIAFLLGLLRAAITIVAMILYQISQTKSLEDVIYIIQSIGGVAIKVGQLLLMGLGAPLMLIYSVFSKIFEKLPGYLDVLLKYAEKIYNKVIPFINDIIEAIKTGNFEKFTGRINYILEDIQWNLNRFYKRNLKQKIDNLRGSLSEVQKVLYTIFSIISSRLSKLTAAQVIFGAFGVAAVGMVLSLIRLNDAASRFILTVRQIPFMFTRINQTLHSFNKYIAPSFLITSFALAIGTLALSLKLMSTIPTEDLDRVSKVMAVFGGALMIFAFAMQQTSSIITEPGKIVSVLNPMGGTILAIASSMMILAIALKIMGSATKDLDNVQKTMLYIFEFMIAMTAVTIVLAKLAPEMAISAFSFTGFAASVYILTRAFLLLSKLGNDIDTSGLTIIFGLMLALSLSVSIAAKATAGAALSLLAFTTSLIIILGSLTMFMSLPWDLVKNAMEKARQVFELLLPLIIAVSIANKLNKVENPVSIIGKLSSFIVSLGAFLILFGVYAKIFDTVEHPVRAIATLGFIVLFVTAAAAALIYIHSQSEILFRKTLDLTSKAVFIERSTADIAVLILGMAASIILIAAAAKTFATVPWYGTVAALLMFVVIAGVMEEVVYASKSLHGVSVKPILGMIASVIAIMGSMALLTFAAKDNPVAVLAAAGAVAIALIGLAILMKAMSGFQRSARQLNTNVGSALDEILPIMALLGLVAFMMVYVTDKIYIEDDIIAFDATMGILMLGMVGIAVATAFIIKILGSIKIEAGTEKKMWSLMGMYASVIVSLSAIAGSLWLISQIPVTGLKTAGITIGIISGALLALMLIIPLISKLYKNVNAISFMEVGAGLAILSTALLVIVGALSLMEQFTDIEHLKVQCIAIGGLLLELGVISGILSKLNASNDGTAVTQVAFGLLAMSGSILVIASAFAVMEGVGLTPEKVKAYASAAAVLLAVLFAGSAILLAVAKGAVTVTPALYGLAAVLGSMGVIVMGLGSILIGATDAFKTFASTSESEINVSVNNMLLFLQRIPEIIAAFTLMLIQVAPMIGIAISVISTGIITALATAIGNSITAILDALNIVLRAVTNWAKDPDTVNIVHDACYALGIVMADGVVKGFFDGINDSELVTEAFDAIYSKFDLAKPFRDYEANKDIKRYADNLKDAMNKVFTGQATWEEYGDYIIEGLNNGIRKGYWSTAQATAILGEYALDGYADRLEIHSPSLEAMRLGNYTIMGVIEGVQNGDYTLQEAMAACAEGAVNKFSSIFTDSNLLKNSNLFNGNGVKSRAELAQMGRAMVYDDSINDYIEQWEASGYSSLDEYIDANTSQGYNLLENILGKFIPEDFGKDFNFGDFGNLGEGLDDAGDSAKNAKDRFDELTKSVLSSMDIFTEFNREVTMSTHDVLINFMNQIEGVSDWTNMLTSLSNRGLNAQLISDLEEEGPKSFEKVAAIYRMTDRELAMLNAMFEDSYELSQKSIASIDAHMKDINVLTLEDITNEVRDASLSFEKFDYETGQVLGRLQELGQGGNVNLLMRPVIDAKELNELGWDAGEGFATMFTSTFTTTVDDGQEIAANFTPIIVDPKTGKKLGVMTPDEFDEYCFDVLDGVRKDDLNLQIGAVFEGENAVEQANQVAEEIHELHEMLGEEWGKDGFAELKTKATAKSLVQDFEDGLREEFNTGGIRNALTNYGHSAMEAFRAELNFENALKDVKTFRDELSKTISDSLKLFDDVEIKTDEQLAEESISAEKMLYNMTENTKKIGRWATNLSTLAARGMSEGLLNQLRELGPEGANKVEAFIKMSAAQLQKANSLYASSDRLGNYTADKLVSSYAKAGYQTSLGFAEGVDPEAAAQVMYELGTKSLSSLEESLDIHSPSRKTYADGVNTILGFSNGLQDPAAITELSNTIADFGLKVGDMYSSAVGNLGMKADIYNLDSESAYQPVIRPVVDMSGVELGINQFFSTHQFSLAGTIGRAFAAQSKGVSQDTIMITNAIKDLNRRVDQIGNTVNDIYRGQALTRDAIRGVDIRLDTGALVGGIVNQMDTALGAKVVRTKRRKG